MDEIRLWLRGFMTDGFARAKDSLKFQPAVRIALNAGEAAVLGMIDEGFARLTEGGIMAKMSRAQAKKVLEQHGLMDKIDWSKIDWSKIGSIITALITTFIAKASGGVAKGTKAKAAGPDMESVCGHFEMIKAVADCGIECCGGQDGGDEDGDGA